MSKSKDKRARRRQNLPDVRRDYLMHLERQGRVQTTPRQFQQLDPDPWYLVDLGLRREPFGSAPPPGELPPIIRTRDT